MALNLKPLQRQAEARERQIMKLHAQGWTLREIGDRFDISHERARQIIAKANRREKK